MFSLGALNELRKIFCSYLILASIIILNGFSLKLWCCLISKSYGAILE